MFLGELTVQENIAKGSPGPVYRYEDQIKYRDAPQFSFGDQVRMPQEKPKYDFYENALFLDDPIQANNNRRGRVCAPKIGTEPRMAGAHDNANPGPQYMVTSRPEFQKAADYTFGFRRGVMLKNDISTPGAVGPGRYVPEASANPSQKQNFPRWTFQKNPRPEPAVKKYDKHQTYDNRSSLGEQCSSKNRSSTLPHFGTSNREGQKKLGGFADQMRGGQSVKMYHPKF